jgi:hypothetical protein
MDEWRQQLYPCSLSTTKNAGRASAPGGLVKRVGHRRGGAGRCGLAQRAGSSGDMHFDPVPYEVIFTETA